MIFLFFGTVSMIQDGCLYQRSMFISSSIPICDRSAYLSVLFNQKVGARLFMRAAHPGLVHPSVSSPNVSAAHFAISSGIPLD